MSVRVAIHYPAEIVADDRAEFQHHAHAVVAGKLTATGKAGRRAHRRKAAPMRAPAASNTRRAPGVNPLMWMQAWIIPGSRSTATGTPACRSFSAYASASSRNGSHSQTSSVAGGSPA
ncbi:hypothetical protein WJ96_14370 [Burkholderia ubonensis]|uniref:Uncharacterized protein n=1 Tax=Burkholderia ubonensis TaxID=101571 RepID=A0AAW3MQC5_9BURK|nr:hypothetical protein WJ96_14370 [Burkholderia ubonensis]KVZ98099.1 hypothetical protein WL25_07860 [Burkholderia ubonensis]